MPFLWLWLVDKRMLMADAGRAASRAAADAPRSTAAAAAAGASDVVPRALVSTVRELVLHCCLSLLLDLITLMFFIIMFMPLFGEEVVNEEEEVAEEKFVGSGFGSLCAAGSRFRSRTGSSSAYLLLLLPNNLSFRSD